MNVIIIEDEQLSADHLANLLQRCDNSINVTHRFESVKQSVESFRSGVTADLLLVDIHLADGSSFEIFTETEIAIPTIFTTAFDQYAIQAFRTNSIDYLLKPIDIVELQRALDKFKQLNTQQHTQLLSQILLHSGLQQKQFKSRFMVKLGDNLMTVKTEETDHFTYEDGIVLLVNRNGKRYPVDYTLEQLEQVLDPDRFFRISRKIIVNIDAIVKVGNYFNSRLKITTLQLQSDDGVVSRVRVSDFKQWLNK